MNTEWFRHLLIKPLWTVCKLWNVAPFSCCAVLIDVMQSLPGITEPKRRTRTMTYAQLIKEAAILLTLATFCIAAVCSMLESLL